MRRSLEQTPVFRNPVFLASSAEEGLNKYRFMEIWDVAFDRLSV